METETSKFLINILSGSLTVVILCLFLIAFVNLFIKRKRILEQINKKQQEDFEKILLITQIEIQENTLQTIAEEIHDNIGQTLSLINLNISQIDTENSFINSKIKNAESLLSKVIQDLRDISRGLNAEVIHQNGFVSMLKNHIEIVNKNGGNINIEIEGTEQSIPPQHQVLLFRMLQESIANIVKHSKATDCGIHLVYGKERLEVIISDNGIGFDPATVIKGQGINNLFKRAKYIQAEVQITSAVLRGTSISITLPYTTTYS